MLNDPYRMAGFVKFAAAGLGDEGNKFQAAYKENRDSAVAEAITDDALFVRITQLIPQYCYNAKFMNGEPCWKGNATDLLTYLKHDLGDSQAALLPKTAGTLSGELTKLAPALRTAGIRAEKVGRDKRNRILWKLSEIKDQ